MYKCTKFNIILHIFGYKQKQNLCSELLIQYKNMNVSYKLLHFAAAVRCRLPSLFKSVHLKSNFLEENTTVWHCPPASLTSPFFIDFISSLVPFYSLKKPSVLLSTILYILNCT